LPGELEWNRGVVQRALVERKVWEDESKRLYSLNHDFGLAMSGVKGPVRDFLSRSQDADEALRDVERLFSKPGCGEALSRDDEARLVEALSAI